MTMPPETPRCNESLLTTATASAYNQHCFCISPDLAALRRSLTWSLGRTDAVPSEDAHHALFSSLPVFVSDEDVAEMARLIQAIESVVAHAGYQAAALGDAPAIASQVPVVPGVLQGFDFHLTSDGPRLIEINTNAGGAMLVTNLLENLRCDGGAYLPECTAPAAAREALWRMFLDVWRRARGDAPLRAVAIVDERPELQYLRPEFVLFKQMFELNGLAAVIVDPGELRFAGGGLFRGDQRIELVYNRLTDFYLEQSSSEALREAVLADAVVISPNPRDHALYANKRNLATLTDRGQLERWGVPEGVVDVLLRGIPRTELVGPVERESLWQRRKRLFFKPARGHGSRGSYRGDKLTRRVFEDIFHGHYVAQALIPPGARAADPEDSCRTLKFDVRNYVYRGRVLLKAARLYQGQTTNFRTPGGGFAPLLGLPRGC